MKSLKNREEPKKANKKAWKKPVIKEEKSLLETKAGEWGDADGSTQGTYIS